MNAEPSYRMRLSLNVLQHLGLNLYSNVPAVLSEVVANAWDADAGRVEIRLDPLNGQIVIQDDGIGMTSDDLNQRFLLVGYRRREQQPGLTRKDRPPMGRKGIGKLSLFSIADEITVETVQRGQKSALRLRLEEIRKAIGQEATENGSGEYHPVPLPTNSVDFDQGTRITLSGLRRRQTISTVAGLRMRIARRFSIIGPQREFEVLVNDTPIEPSDRGYYDKMQYVWNYGDQSVADLCPNLVKDNSRPNVLTVSNATDLRVLGWLGTVRESKQLSDEGGQNLNRIAIFMRGKMAQEDILSDLTERGVYAGYLIGELQVDGLDTDDGPDSDRDEDAATSSRQRIVEDDPRYIALRGFLKQELKNIQACWSVLRDEDGVRKAEMIPEVRAWIEDLSPYEKRVAKSWLGKINRIRVNEERDRNELFKHAVIAFEFYRLNQNIGELELIPDHDIDSALTVFRRLDNIEASMYGQIVRNRIGIIKTLQEKIDQNQKERIIQEYIFDHLWLLDPSWERVESSEFMEVRMGKLLQDIESESSLDERNARIDIKYRKAAGTHVIIELKKPGVPVSIYTLTKQIGTYLAGMLKILELQDRSNEAVEIVCVLGANPTEISQIGGRGRIDGMLREHNARCVTYDELLSHAFEAYSDYLIKGREADRLSRVVEAIENYSKL